MDGIFLSSLLLSLLGIFNLVTIKPNLAIKQSVILVISSLIYIAIKKSNLSNFIKQNTNFFYWLFIFLLSFNLIVGTTIKGAKRWINLYLFNFQPSELLKPFFILYFANFFVNKEKEINKMRELFYAVILALIPVVLIFKQPDLATSLLYLLVFFTFILFSDIPFSYLLKAVAPLILLIPIGWHFLKSYQKMRLLSFLNPQLDPRGRAYNAIQSVISIGSGGFWGKGLGFGTQSKLSFLPENHTDFAFASFVEQTGFVGAIIIFSLFSILFFSILKRAKKELINKNKFEFFFTLGVFLLIGLQFIINIAMNLKLFPIAGVPLPFISYGGSSLITLFFTLSLI